MFLLRLQSGLSTYTRIIDALEFGHRLKEIVVVDWADAGFPTEGFALAAFYWRRGYPGGTAWAYGLRETSIDTGRIFLNPGKSGLVG